MMANLAQIITQLTSLNILDQGEQWLKSQIWNRSFIPQHQSLCVTMDYGNRILHMAKEEDKYVDIRCILAADDTSPKAI